MSSSPSSTVISPPARQSYFSRFGKILLLSFPVGLALCLLLCAVINYFMPKKFESSAIIQVQSIINEPSTADISTADCFGQQFDVIRSPMTLKIVVQELALTKRWSMTEEEVLSVLRQCVDVTNVRGTDLVEITVKTTSPADSHDIAQSIFRAYKERLETKQTESAEAALVDLGKSLKDQSLIVDEKAKQLDNLKKRLVTTAPATDAQKVVAQSQLDSLTNAKNDDERLFITTQIFKDDNIVKTANVAYLKVGQELEELAQQGVKIDDPRYQKQQQIVAEQYEKMLGLVKTYQDSLVQIVNGGTSAANPQAREMQLVAQAATQELEEAKQLKDKMQDLLATKKITIKEPIASVFLHEEPQIPQHPVSPNTTLNLIMSAIAGVTAFPLLVLLLTTIIHLFFPVKK